MTEDPRCCGSGMCIIDPEGRCWCGQQWDGQKMCAPQRAAASSGTAPGREPEAAPQDAAGAPASPSTFGRPLALAALAGALATFLPQPVQAQAGPRAAPQVPAAGLTAAETRALQAVVQGQLKALAAGDAAAAYAFASAGIQQQFGDAARFMAMVRSAYPMIIAPRTLAFRVPERQAAGVVQPVQLRDASGRAWLATYQLEAQADGGWRISGCIVTADEQRLST
jgi:hypothetical protein